MKKSYKTKEEILQSYSGLQTQYNNYLHKAKTDTEFQLRLRMKRQCSKYKKEYYEKN